MRFFIVTFFMTSLAMTCPQVNKTNIACENLTEGYEYIIDRMEINGNQLILEFFDFVMETEFPFTESFNGLTTTNFCDGQEKIISEETAPDLVARNESIFYDDRFETKGTTIYTTCYSNDICDYEKVDYHEICRF